MTSEESFGATGLALLRAAWAEALSREELDSKSTVAPIIDEVFQASTGSYAKAAIVQTLGKAVNLSLDPRVVQKGEDDDDSAWDARTFARATFVIWNNEANRPFSHAADPYVSNPLRIPRIDERAKSKAKDKVGFDAIANLLNHASQINSKDEAYSNLVEVLVGLRRYLSDKSVDYPLPKRASIDATIESINFFLSERSGGARLQAIVAALFESLADAGLKIGDVTTGHINAPDSGAKKGGDVEFEGLDGAFGVEVKDRPLSKDDFLASIEKARIASVSDLMFVVRATALFDGSLDSAYFAEEVGRQFSSGLNIYVERFDHFSRLSLSLVGEIGRQGFLRNVGNALETQSAMIAHKWAWASIVKSL